MKQLILISILLLLFTGYYAEAQDCRPKSCDEQLADAKKEIARLKKQVKNLSQKQTDVVTVTAVETKTEYVTREVLVPTKDKNILSAYLVNSYFDLELERKNNNNNTYEATMSKKLGLGVMYQRNIYKNVYLGGAIDTNFGYSVNLGLGF